MPRPPFKGAPLSDDQLRLLRDTPFHRMQEVFKGYPRLFLERERKRAQAKFPAELTVEAEAARVVEQSKARDTARLLRESLAENARLREELERAAAMPPIHPRDLTIRAKRGEREATAVAVASDWHCEERVLPESVNGLNEFSLAIFDERARWFFKNALSLLHKEAREINIRNLVLAVLGDLMSNDIHEDLAESNQLGSMMAAELVQDTLAAGIWRLLKETPKSLSLTVPWKLGNHPRTTHRQRIQTEAEHSLEWLIAHSLAREFAREPRVKFIRERSLLTYLDVHGTTLRLLHGHAVEYQGGVGGITIPINKAIAQWDKGRRANLTVMGHFHQLTFGPGFIVNGSLIGYSPFAVKIKAAPERPAQAFFLVDAQHGLTVRAPILLEAA